MSIPSGTLVLRPICAKLTHDTETFGKMDPYCVVVMGNQKHRTRVHDSAGKFPNWQDQLVFNRTNEDIVSIEVWDKDTASSDDLVGEATLSIHTITSKPNYEEWVPLTYKGKKAGEIRISVQFNTTAQANQPPQVHGVPANIVNMSGYQYAPYPMPGQTPYAYPYPQQPQTFAPPSQAGQQRVQQGYPNLSSGTIPTQYFALPQGAYQSQPMYAQPNYPGTAPPSYPGTIPPLSYPGQTPPSYPGAMPPSYPGTMPPSYPGIVPPQLGNRQPYPQQPQSYNPGQQPQQSYNPGQQPQIYNSGQTQQAPSSLAAPPGFQSQGPSQNPPASYYPYTGK